MLSVNELISHVEYDMRLLAGADGVHRMITWAHAVDAAEPWLWVEPGDLMMTTGSNLPSEAAGQVEWLKLLDSTRVAGVLIEIPEDGLTLTPELLQAADGRNLPLLSAARPILFNKIAHLVVESALRSRWERTEMVQRLFSSYTGYLRRGMDRHQRLQRLCRILDAEVRIIHDPTGSTIFHHVPTTLSATAHRWVRVELPGLGREVAYVKAASTALIHDDDFVWHWATLVTMELGFEKVQLDQARTQGQPILLNLIRGDIDAGTIAPLLEIFGTADQIQVVALDIVDSETERDEHFSQIHLIPGLRDEPQLICEFDGILYLALRYPVSKELLVRLGTGGPLLAGLSRPVSASNRYPEAAEQALLALKHAPPEAPGFLKFDDYVNQTLGVFDRETTQQQIHTVLGPLIEYDSTNGTELLHTLATYLDADRSGTQSAQTLVIHRQTLVYRLKMIQRLTSIDPNSTVGIVTFHSALMALQQVQPHAKIGQAKHTED